MNKRLPAIGLHAILEREDCESVHLSGDAECLLVRYESTSSSGWQDSRASGHPLSIEELLQEIEDRLGVDVRRVRCVMPDEIVDYIAERSGVRIERSRRQSMDSPRAIIDRYPEISAVLGIAGTKRGYKLRQAAHFATVVLRALASSTRSRQLRVLDLACGRNYLGFLLLPVLRERGFQVNFTGIDVSPTLVEKSRKMAEAIGWRDVQFKVGDLRELSVERGSYDLVLALHACDTLSDEAIRVAWEARAEHIFAVPCCHSELRIQLGDYPLDWFARYSLLEQRLADVLTDGFRCHVLEMLGYGVRVLEFADSELTPKNLLIHAKLGASNARLPLESAKKFMNAFEVRPRLADLLDSALEAESR